MVQEYVSPVRVHKYSFEMVMAAYERRFPSCPQIPVVIECVITEDSWSADDSQRHTTRRCQLNVDAPYLLKKMIGVDYIYFIQKNHLDLKNRVLEIEATNETFAARVSVVEKCRYYVHPENPEWTCFEQSALLDVKNFFGLESTVEKIAMKQYAANIAKGKELIEVFMKEVHTDGVKDLRPWTSSDAGRNRELRRVVSRGTEPLSPRPVAEPKKHSQPGTSKISGSSNLALRRHSSQKLIKSRSKSALSNREMDSSRLLNQKRSESTGPSDRKNWDLNISKSKQQVNDSSPKKKLNDKNFLSGSKSVTRFYNEMQSQSGIWSKTKDDKKKKVVLSNMDLKIRDNNENRDNERFKSCICSSSRSSAAEFVTRWDHLVVMLVCAIILGLVLSTPLSVLFRRAR